jgi:hypothetical protein
VGVAAAKISRSPSCCHSQHLAPLTKREVSGQILTTFARRFSGNGSNSSRFAEKLLRGDKGFPLSLGCLSPNLWANDESAYTRPVFFDTPRHSAGDGCSRGKSSLRLCSPQAAALPVTAMDARSTAIIFVENPIDMPPPVLHPRDPLHGITLESIVKQLVAQHGWAEMGHRIRADALKSSGRSLGKICLVLLD